MGKGLHHPLHQCFIPFLLQRVIDSHSKTLLSQVLAPVQHSIQERMSATECTDWSRINPDLYNFNTAHQLHLVPQHFLL